MKRTVALVLALVLALSLTACGPKQEPPAPSSSPSAAPSETASPSPSPSDSSAAVDLLPDNAIDATQQLLGFPNSTVLLTVDGVEVTAEEYLYWLGNMTSYYNNSYLSYYGTALDFTQEAEPGVTWDQKLKDLAYANVVLLALTPSLAQEEGIELSQEQQQKLAQDHADALAQTGREQYAYLLQAMNVNDSTAYRMDSLSALLTAYQDKQLETIRQGLTPQDAAQYAQDNDLLRAKHILLLTKDPNTGEEYDDARKAQQKAKAEEVLKQLQEGGDFDTLMQENSEDTGLSAYPNGYLFSSGEMVAEFEDGTRALEYGEISDLIPSTYGYHIILRLDPDCDELRDQMAQEQFDTQLQAAVDAAQVVKAPQYDSFTTADYYEKLQDFQTTLDNPSADVQDQSQATLEPVPGDGGESPSDTPSEAPSESPAP